jgi:medium-chain acyl-[acyl-carrier-protein] hydrolase
MSWIVPRRISGPAFRLFCLPYAGGGAAGYAQWPAAFGRDVEVCPIELPGRQTRWRERPFTRVGSLATALREALADDLDVPYALFGHSMGALLAFELARTLRREGAPGPRVLFVSGAPAPQLPRLQPNTHDQPDSAVLDRLRAMGGVAEQLCAEPELVELLLPAIRADFEVCETYEHRDEPPFSFPIVAFTGTEDGEAPPERMVPWSEQTTGPFERHLLPGDHFFPHSAQAALLEVVRSVISRARAITAEVL